MKFPALSLLLIASLAPRILRGAPLERASVIDNPMWLLHVDLDALRKTSPGQELLREMRLPSEEPRYGVIQLVIGFDPRTALHGLTVYGVTAAPEDGVALVYGDIDGPRLTGLAKNAENYRSVSHGRHEIASWIDAQRRDKEGGKIHSYSELPRTYASIHENRMVLFAQREDRLIEALDVLDGKKANLSGSVSNLVFETRQPTVLQAAARQFNLPSDNPASVLLRQTRALRLEVFEAGSEILANMVIEPQNAEASPQLANLASGLIALLSLQTDNPDAVRIARGMTVEQTDGRIRVALKLPADDVVASMKSRATAASGNAQAPK